MDTSATSQAGSPLLKLPAELIQHIMLFLSPNSIGNIALTCRLLNEHSSCNNVWKVLIWDNVPNVQLHSPLPCSSYRELFLLHHPYWFIPKYKIWYSDNQHTGRLLIARYSQSRQTIEAYALAAERGRSAFEFWSWNPDVIIHTFDPKVQLDLNQPVIKLNAATAATLRPKDRFPGEVNMPTYGGPGLGGLNSQLMLARPMPPESIYPSMQVWPPLRLPAAARSRNSSSESFRGSGHHPTKMSELSEHTFRIRRWMDFTSRYSSIRVGEEVSTYATLPPEAYTPTKAKPWRGIWCGDYSGHGCEFLVVLQPDEPIELPAGVLPALHQQRRMSDAASEGSYQTALSSVPADETAPGSPFEYEMVFDDLDGDHGTIAEDAPVFDQTDFAASSSSRSSDFEGDEEDAKYSGQLMAVKLTGDPNIPRGEYTFIAPDIAPAGTLRVATEEIFKGARVVKSVGHIAARNFRDDDYIPSQLILISHDTLAQYWETFGHVSFYRRVDIDKFIDVD